MSRLDAQTRPGESGGMDSPYIKSLTLEIKERVRRNPSLNVDSFVPPEPQGEENLRLDLDRSLVWEEERELLGYMEVWTDPERKRIHIHKQITSPFGRGKGIGSSFLARLAREADQGSVIDVYVWERQSDSVSFYKKRGFFEGERIPRRALLFVRLEGFPAGIAATLHRDGESAEDRSGTADELGKVRHDAKKAIRLIADMAGALSAENCSRIIEDINRETTALVNTLNLFRDSVQRFRTVNLKELVMDRIVPLVEHSPVPCALNLHFAPRLAEARAYYLEVARATVNLVSNALDAIREKGQPGVLTIALDNDDSSVLMTVEDNGAGIGMDRLRPGPDGVPQFVGVTTKGGSGEGQGTRQIYATFGAQNIEIHSEEGVGTRWTIRLPRADDREDEGSKQLELRWEEMQALAKEETPQGRGDRSATEALIWRHRRLDILIWDLVLQFGRRNNVREIYRSLLSYRSGLSTEGAFAATLEGLRTETPSLRRWLADAAAALIQGDALLRREAPTDEYGGTLFEAYSQATGRTVIFTLDPGSGHFGATDRKLAEHADFVPYLGGKRATLLRGEFFGELRNPANPIQLGVWEIGDANDGRKKAALVRAGARRLLSMGLKKEKKLLLYEATWRRGELDLDSNRSHTLQSVAKLADHELGEILVKQNDDLQDFAFTD